LQSAVKTLIAGTLMAVNLHLIYKYETGDASGNPAQVLWTLGL